MQGIFDFNGDIVDFDSDCDEFDIFPELSIPQRWYGEGNNSKLGDMLKVIRGKLKLQQAIEITSYRESGLYVVITQPGDIHDPQSNYRKGLVKLVQNPDNILDYESLLIIMPEYLEMNSAGHSVPKGTIKNRAKIRKQIDYSNSLRLLEAIDHKSFYAVAKKADLLIAGIGRAKNKYTRIKKDALEPLFNKTDLNIWFNASGFKNKKDITARERLLSMEKLFQGFIGDPSANNLYEVILESKNGLKLKFQRDEIVYALLRALKESVANNISVYEAMKQSRNLIRRTGRKINGKCIGTTLLTKGLEFDTVAIMDAHKFDCPKHLYVALTRSCKKLIIFSEKSYLLGHDRAI